MTENIKKTEISQEIDPIKGRFVQFLSKIGLKIPEASRSISVDASNFQGANLKSSMGSDKVLRILSTYGELSAEWLMRGVGPMLLNDGTMATDHSIAVHTNEGSITQNNIPTGADLPTPAPAAPDCELCSKLTYAKMEVEHLKTLIEAKNETIQVLKDCLK